MVLPVGRAGAIPVRLAAPRSRVRGGLAGAVGLLALLLAAVLAVAAATPAAAHAQFLGSDPAEGSTLEALPAVVTMSYDEEIAPQFVDTAVVPPGGEPVVVESRVDGRDVLVPVGDVPELADVVTTTGGAGQWQVVARVVSVDGHPVEHTTSLTLEPRVSAVDPPAPTGTTGAGPTADPTAGATDAADPTPGTADTATGGSDGTGAAQGVEADPASGTTGDPLADAAGELPGWLGVLLAVALLGAALTAVLVHLRRRGPDGPGGTGGDAGDRPQGDDAR